MSAGRDVHSGAPEPRIATAPINWNNDDLPGWRPPVPFPALLDRMREAGYEATEFGSSFPTYVDATLVMLSEKDMSLCGAYQWLPLRDPAALDSTLKALTGKLALLRDCGCSHLIVSDALVPERVQMAGHVPSDGSASLDEAGFLAIADGTARTTAVAEKFDVAVHYHNHVGTYVETPPEVDRLLPLLQERHLDLCFDTGHYAYGGGDPVAFTAAHAGSIGYLHLKDVDGTVLKEARQQRWSFLEALTHIVFVPLGRGIVDIAGIVASLQDAGYGGWIVIEQDTCAGDPTATARHNLDYLHTVMARMQTQAEAQLRSNR